MSQTYIAPPPAAAAAPVSAMPTYADQLIAVLLGAAGQGLVSSHTLTGAQLNTAVGDIVSLIGVAWGVFAASPTNQSPIAWLMGLLGRAPRAKQSAWNAAIQEAKAALLPQVEALVDSQIKARAGLLASPVDAVANAGLGALAGQAARAVTLPHLKV